MNTIEGVSQGSEVSELEERHHLKPQLVEFSRQLSYLFAQITEGPERSSKQVRILETIACKIRLAR